MGALDKSLRVLVAVIIVLLYYLNVITGTLAYVLIGIAIIFLITSFINFCPLYTVLGINTCKGK
ncbi:DUF2892 domain-containing protein [Olleya sp. Ti.3.14]|uniref:YgaP family membrane protein n=1 Tax=Olleya sp. Ti.3.14 TaxID=3121297 RepID=UPI00311D91D5